MKAVVDKNNPLVAETFRQFGEVLPLGTKDITRESVRNADILVVRSETKVTRELLDGSSVKFVGTATIGTDHVDAEYLRSRHIGFASAPGSNANSVAEYMVASLLLLARRKGFSLKGKTIGVVGVGNVGSKVVRNAQAMGMTVLKNDPPLARATGDSSFLPLGELMDADIITLHVPLTKTGPDATHHLFDAPRIHKMKREAILINTARGSVIEGKALLNTLAGGHLAGAVLDVWENEPAIDISLLEKADISTSHIAGYSFDGKLAAVRQIYSAACKFFGEKENWGLETLIPKPAMERIAIPPELSRNESREEILYSLVRQCYDIECDDRSLRDIRNVSEEEQRLYFRRLRTEYRIRREFFNTTVELPVRMNSLREILTAFGFRVEVS
ncbi:MAG: 4-phosphoerythronate dehydrogenase [Bacteroidota bacterium]|nr:4-phosphoerythronate dehydrogenase [Bacteroidota bacterium]